MRSLAELAILFCQSPDTNRPKSKKQSTLVTVVARFYWTFGDGAVVHHSKIGGQCLRWVNRVALRINDMRSLTVGSLLEAISHA
jgi:hypothetical protein